MSKPPVQKTPMNTPNLTVSSNLMIWVSKKNNVEISKKASKCSTAMGKLQILGIHGNLEIWWFGSPKNPMLRFLKKASKCSTAMRKLKILEIHWFYQISCSILIQIRLKGPSGRYLRAKRVIRPPKAAKIGEKWGALDADKPTNETKRGPDVAQKVQVMDIDRPEVY